MNRTLTMKEKLVLVFLVLIVVVALWYLLFYTRMVDATEALGVEKASIEEQTQLLQAEVGQYKKWSDELGLDMQNQTDDFKKIADFNNIRELTAELNSILADSTAYTMSFAPLFTPEDQQKNCYRRDVALTFTTGSYESARAIIQKLNDCQYGCLITDLALSTGNSASGEAAFNVSTTISIFEYSEWVPAEPAATEEVVE